MAEKREEKRSLKKSKKAYRRLEMIDFWCETMIKLTFIAQI